jgi:hypothetical protein
MMRTVIKFYSAIFLISAVLPAFSSPFQQSINSFAKQGLISNTYSSNTVKDELLNTLKDSLIKTERDTSFNQINTKLKAAAERLKQNTASLEEYVRVNDFNTEFCFMVDMSIPSGKKRFFVYNIKKDAVEVSSLVSHGSGSYKPGCNDLLVFSNIPNSYATSLGKYKIGNSYTGQYGLSFKLYGLDSTNNNAYQRAIVLHSDNYVPIFETYPRHIYESAGCPIVSPNFLAVLDKYIKTSDKPILLWIYN